MLRGIKYVHHKWATRSRKWALGSLKGEVQTNRRQQMATKKKAAKKAAKKSKKK